MTLEEIQKAIDQLSVEEQLTLLENLVQALRSQKEKPVDRHSLVNQL
ncbi:MAG: hypothetical protein AAGA80_14435 [Cyanobacteria bacterium P01_F01_bin.143]